MRDPEAEWFPSPNCGDRRNGLLPKLIVLHYTAMPSARAARDWLCAPQAQVSAHYVIARSGQLWQLVDEAQRAWHAGVGHWAGHDDINSRSIGIELANTGFEPFPLAQMRVLEALLSRIMARWDIAPDCVIGHSDLAIGRKIDPGPQFDWSRLERRGLAIRPQPLSIETADMADFRAAAVRRGYTCSSSDDALLAAVRLRYRPQGQGALCPEDIAVLGA